MEMYETLTNGVDSLEEVLWVWIGVPLIFLLGLWITLHSKFYQIRKFPQIVTLFTRYMAIREGSDAGVHPLKAFFACVGGCIGIGNIVGVCTAIQIGGPGALIWLWVTALFGMMLKYAEVYLGIKFRVAKNSHGYRGGPMYYLQSAYNSIYIPKLVALLLCVYGVEIYQFRVVTQSISYNYDFSEVLVAGVLLILVLYAASGGVRRVGNISGIIIPIFVIVYGLMVLWILALNMTAIPTVFMEVIESAFSGYAAVGGFTGATVMMAISQGVRRGAYSGDVGIGYASVIHSETMVKEPAKQASLVIFDMFLDAFIVCTLTILLILVTGVWDAPVEAGQLVQLALEKYFPYMHIFIPIFLFILGYSTINAYFVVGLNCATFLGASYGKVIFYAYAILVLLIFSFLETATALSVMAITGCLLLIINGIGIAKLLHHVQYPESLEPDL